MFLDRVRVNAVVKLGESSIQVPIKRLSVTFIVFEPLEFFDQVEFKLGAQPGPELERDVLVGVGSTVSARRGNNADCAGSRNPLLDREEKLFRPASFLIPSNSRELYSALYIFSHAARKSRVSLDRSHCSLGELPPSKF